MDVPWIGHLDGAMHRNRPSDGAPDTEDRRGTEAVSSGPHYIGDWVPDRPAEDRQGEADHSAEQPVLDRSARGDVQPEDPHVRLNLAVAFIARKGLASEFALWLREHDDH
jgi:hypothetical protein